MDRPRNPFRNMTFFIVFATVLVVALTVGIYFLIVAMLG